jgi:putative FmdB family regulatory protein
VPIYEFRCGACGERFEALVAAGTETVECGACGAAETRRVLSPQAAPMAVVKSPAATRRQERRNAQLRERTKAEFVAKRRRARDARRDERG